MTIIQSMKTNKLKTKKIQAGVYKITTPKDIYQVEFNQDRNEGWDLLVLDNNHFEIIDVCSSLKESKEVIKMIEARDIINND